MCTPMIALTAASTLMGAMGNIQQGQATAAASRYNAQIADMNAQMADRRAKDAIERGKVAEQQKRQQVADIRGKQVAAMAANGVDVSYGSPLDTIVDTSVLGELDALTIRSNAYREAYDDRVDAVNKRASANLDSMNASSAETGGYLKAAGTVLTGAGKAYGYSQGYYPRTSSIGAIS